MTRDEQLWGIRKACIKANQKLWNDHGNILMRVVAQGVAVPTQIGLADVLLAWQRVIGASDKEQDEDAVQVSTEIVTQIISLWNVRTDDLTKQSDECISYLATRIIKEPIRKRRSRP